MRLAKLDHFVITLLCVIIPALAQTPATTPSQAYLDYRAAVTKAATLDDVLPHLSKEYVAMLKARPASDRPVWLKRLKESASRTEVVVTKETIAGSQCTLETTGTDPDATRMKGTITMIKEGGAWRLEGEGWTMAPR